MLSDGAGGAGIGAGDDEPFSLRRERDSGGLGVNGHGAKRES